MIIGEYNLSHFSYSYFIHRSFIPYLYKPPPLDMVDEITTMATPSFSTVGDITCAILCFAILLLGPLGNLSAALLFATEIRSPPDMYSEKKRCFDSLFLWISVTDTLICLCMLPVAVTLLEDREPALFASPLFCTVWGVLWTVLPYLSVFLVAALSLTRTYALVRPLGHVSCHVVTYVIIVYTCYLGARSVVPLVTTSYTSYMYFSDSISCMEDTQMNAYWHFKMIANQVVIKANGETVSQLLYVIEYD